MVDFRELIKKYNCCVIIPTYNNCQTLKHVIEKVKEITDQIIIINDGSNDSTAEILSSLDGITILQNEVNQGKGFSLKKAFKYAVSQGYEHAITIDSDGQHLPADIPLFLTKLDEAPGSLIIGARNMNVENVPTKSSFGKKFSNFWITITTGLQLSDTQSGYRLYPISKLKDIKYLGSRFEFEVEVIVRSVWKGIKVESVPVHVYYPPKEERISHYRPFTDFLRISLLNTALVAMAFLFFWPKKIFMQYKNTSIKQLFKDELWKSTDSNVKIALSLGFGMFMGIVPIWGYQLLVGFTLAHLLKLNKALFFITANISIPPLIPFILFASLYAGSIMTGEIIKLPAFHNIDLQQAISYLGTYIIGAIGLAIVAGLSCFAVSYLSLILLQKVKN